MPDCAAEQGEIATPTLIPPPLGRDPGRFVDVNLLVGREFGAGLRWTIDRFGEEVPGSREPTDAYQADRISDNPTLTDPDRFHLGPMPPITSAEGSAEGSLSDATNWTD